MHITASGSTASSSTASFMATGTSSSGDAAFNGVNNEKTVTIDLTKSRTTYSYYGVTFYYHGTLSTLYIYHIWIT